MLEGIVLIFIVFIAVMIRSIAPEKKSTTWPKGSSIENQEKRIGAIAVGINGDGTRHVHRSTDTHRCFYYWGQHIEMRCDTLFAAAASAARQEYYSQRSIPPKPIAIELPSAFIFSTAACASAVLRPLSCAALASRQIFCRRFAKIVDAGFQCQNPPDAICIFQPPLRTIGKPAEMQFPGRELSFKERSI